MTPIVIKWRAFNVRIYDVNSLLKLPLANVRKLWRLMFDAIPDNEMTIGTIREWLPEAVASTKEQHEARRMMLDGERLAAENVRRTVATFGSVATKEQKAAVIEARQRVKYAEGNAKAAATQHERAKKLQTIFNEMAAKAKI